MRWTDLLWFFAAVSMFLPCVRVLASNVEVLAVELLRLNGDTDHVELAAFVVRGKNGELELVHWPPPARGVFRAAHWDGPLPSGVVGVIHTHPWTIPRPSRQDEWEARRLAMPVYVVSRTSLCVAASAGGVSCSRIKTWS